jgi:twitching motility two-component system response regulator PilH
MQGKEPDMAIRIILAVDDSPTDLQFFTEVLGAKGYQVLTALSGEEGIAKAKSEKPDLILMDVVMPGLNGFQATRKLQQDEATRGIPVIICTNKSQDTDRIWGLKQGACDYVTKPVDTEELLGKIAARG